MNNEMKDTYQQKRNGSFVSKRKCLPGKQGITQVCLRGILSYISRPLDIGKHLS